MSFEFWLDVGGKDAADDVAFEAVGLGDGAAGGDGAGGGIRGGRGCVGGEDAVGEGGKLLCGVGALAIGVVAGA